MRIAAITIALLVSTLCFAQQQHSFVRPLPDRAKAVFDFGGFLATKEEKALEQELIRYQKASTNAIVVITLDSLVNPETKEAYNIEQASLMYFNTWGIGDKEKNNGILIMATKHPRGVRIATGVGIDYILTDAICQQIIDRDLVPNFKKGLFADGFTKAVKAIEQALAEPARAASATPLVNAADTSYASTINYATPPRAASGNTGMLTFLLIFGIVFIAIVVFGIVQATKKVTGLISGKGYRESSGLNDLLSDDRPYYQRHRLHNSAIIAAESNSFSSSDNSSSSDSGSSSSFSGGSSDGGGASGSW